MDKVRDMIHNLNGKDDWTTYDDMFRRIVFSDGPTGLRHQEGECDHLGINESQPATCFPTLCALGSSWNSDLVYKVAAAIAEEAAEQGVDVLLAPGVNMKRSPLCGRNFEYFSEDPHLSGELGAAYVSGLQDNGIGASLKHFAANSQEAYRLSVNAVVDDRALEEIYLEAFRIVVTKAKPWTVMGAYNRLNGTYCCENKRLLTDILRDRWGFDGLVISDWFAVNDIGASIKAGMDLEMPGVGEYTANKLLKQYRTGEVKKGDIERAFGNLKALSEKCVNDKKASGKADMDAHHELARAAARETIILLKNNNEVLPLKTGERVYFGGELLEHPNYQGNGSSKVNAAREDGISEFLRSRAETPQDADKLVYFAGLSDCDESEGFDRTTLELPKAQIAELDALAALNKPLVLVLMTGSVVEIPCFDALDGILQAGFAGQGMGKALTDVLYGDANPSAKTGETYPLSLRDTPAYGMRADSQCSVYGESIFIGYRHYDKRGIGVRFPFGYGLSYSRFEYGGLEIERRGKVVRVSCDVTNVSAVDGAQVLQVYVGLNESRAVQPERQLKLFKKVWVKAGTTERVRLELPVTAFRYFNPIMGAWTFATGENRVALGVSSRDILCESTVEITECDTKPIKIHRNTTMSELAKLPIICDFVATITKAAMQAMAADSEDAAKELERNIDYIPLRNLCQYGKGEISDGQMDMLINIMNTIITNDENSVKRKVAVKELKVFEGLLKKLVG